MSFIGIDIGGTKISGVLLKDDQIVNRSIADTGADRPVKQILDTLFGVIRELHTEEVKAIGIGVPGILDVKEGLIIGINNIPEFNGFNLKQPVVKEFGLPVYINNDANCFTLSEAYFGAGKSYNNIIGITLGTGVGGGLVINRQVYSGNLGAAGEFGCLPYLDGLYENYGGSKFFQSEYGKTGKELFELAEAGDKVAQEAFLKFGEHIATLLTTLIYSFAPEIIIIGGSITNAFKYFKPSIDKMLETFAIPIIAEHVKIMPAELSDSGILGAAALAISEYETEK